MIGYACINQTLRNRNIFSSRTCRLKNISTNKIKDLAAANLRDLDAILHWNQTNKINVFRVSSGVCPFADHPSYGYKLAELNLDSLFDSCRKTGANQYLTTHPGQYTVLLSDNSDTRSKSILTMEYHWDLMSRITDRVGFPINVHIGFSRDKIPMDKLLKRMGGLSKEPWFSNMTLENDDKESGWSIEDLLVFHEEFGTRLVFDIHHYRVGAKGDLSERDSYELARLTWKDSPFPQKIHISESAPGKNPRKHSDFIENPLPDYIHSDTLIIVEAKQKELAVEKLRRNK